MRVVCADNCISQQSKPEEANSNKESERSKVVAASAVGVSVFGHLVWQCVLYEFMEAEDRQAWLRARAYWVDYYHNKVATGTAGHWCQGYVLAHHETTWRGYLILEGAGGCHVGTVDVVPHVRKVCDGPGILQGGG